MLLHNSADSPGERQLLNGARNESTGDLLFSRYALFRWFLVIVIPFGINLGAGYIAHKGDDVGVFKPPSTTTNPEKLGLGFDLMITGFLTAFFSTYISSRCIFRDIKAGKVSPVPCVDSLLHSSRSSVFWRVYCIFPLFSPRLWFRSLMSAIIVPLPMVVLTVLLVEGICLQTDESPCTISVYDYRFIKAAWAGCVTMMLFPAVFLSAIHRPNIPDQLLPQPEGEQEEGRALPSDSAHNYVPAHSEPVYA